MPQLSQIDQTSLLSFLFLIFLLYGTKWPEQYHPVMKDTTYRLWNLATTSLLQRNSSNIISCNGSFKDKDYASKYTMGQNVVPY